MYVNDLDGNPSIWHLTGNMPHGKLENKSSNIKFHKWNGWEFIYIKN